LDEVQQLTEKPKSKYNWNLSQNSKKISIDIPILKNLTNIFAGLMLILLIVVFLCFIPVFNTYCINNPELKSFSENKIKFKYITNVFSEVDTLSKVKKNFFLKKFLI